VLTVVPRYSPYEGVEPTGVSVPLDLPPQAQLPPAEPAAALPCCGQETAGATEPGSAAAAAAAAAEAEAAEAEAASATSSGLDAQEPAEGSGGQASQAAAGVQQVADLWLCEQRGVKRVFVDHPLFYSSGGWVAGALSKLTAMVAGPVPGVAAKNPWECRAAYLQLRLLTEKQGFWLGSCWQVTVGALPCQPAVAAGN